MAVIVCPICSTRYRVTDAQLSKANRLKCKKCKTVFPVSDNIRDEQTIDDDDSSAPSPPASETASFPSTLDFPDTRDSQADQEDNSPSVPEADSEAMTLDFNFSSMGDGGNAAPPMDFSFSAVVPDIPEENDEGDPEENDEGDVELEDHISDSLHSGQGHLDVGLGGLSLSGGPDDGETTLSMNGGSSLDFSFSAVMPDAPPDDGEDEGVFAEDGDVSEDDGGMHDLSLGLDLGALPDDATMTMSDSTSETSSSMNLDISLTGTGEGDDEGNAGYDDDGDADDQEELDTCCVDSLAMGMTTCELCGRDLQGADSQKFAQLRREQLRGELPEGEAHIVFSSEGTPEEGQTPLLKSDDDDFSDVERALDALADGSFEKEIKKRESKKNRGQHLKLLGVGVVFGAIVIIGGGIMLLPSNHERLLSRYENLMAQPEVNPKTLVSVFLDAAAKQDQEIFDSVSVMSAMPNISGGSITTVGEDYERTSLGQLGKDVADLQAELGDLQTTYQNTEKQWQEASAVDLSPDMINGNIDRLLEKQADLQAEFNEKEQESLQKTISLQTDIQEAEDELDANRIRAQQYIDATDRNGKAMYTASVRNQQSLSDKIGKLGGLLADERLSHARRMRDLEDEYDPQFQKITEELAVQREVYDMAVLYADSEKSPLIVLDIKLKELKNTMVEKEQLLAEKEQQLSTALNFFKRQERRQQVEKSRNEAEFVHISKNVVASVNFKGLGKQDVPVVLKRYQAIIGEQIIQGDWVVEAVLR